MRDPPEAAGGPYSIYRSRQYTPFGDAARSTRGVLRNDQRKAPAKSSTPLSDTQMRGPQKFESRRPPNIIPAPANSSVVGVIRAIGFVRGVLGREAFAFAWRREASEIGDFSSAGGSLSSSFARISSISRSNLSAMSQSTITVGHHVAPVDACEASHLNVTSLFVAVRSPSGAIIPSRDQCREPRRG